MLTQRRHEEIVKRKVRSARRAAWMENRIRQQEEEIKRLKNKLWNLANTIDELEAKLPKGQIRGYYINGGGTIDCVTTTALLNKDESTPENEG